MASIGKAIRARLLADAAVLAIVSTRIHPNQAPQSTAPGTSYIVYSVISRNHTNEKSGTAGLCRARVQVVSVGGRNAYDTAEDLSDKVRLALSNYSGTSAGVVVTSILPASDADRFDVPVDGSDETLDAVFQDFTATYRETSPN
jgi:hypothetical protein